MKKLDENKNSKHIYETITEFIYRDEQDLVDVTFKDNTPVKSLYDLILGVTKLEDDVYRELIFSANDFQLGICIWANNLILDSNGRVENNNNAVRRALSYLEGILVEPSAMVEFADWELEHHT